MNSLKKHSFLTHRMVLCKFHIFQYAFKKWYVQPFERRPLHCSAVILWNGDYIIISRRYEVKHKTVRGLFIICLLLNCTTTVFCLLVPRIIANGRNLSENYWKSGKNMHLNFTIKSHFLEKSIIELVATFENNSNRDITVTLDKIITSICKIYTMM